MPRLTKRTVDALTSRRKDYIVFDDDLRGFGVRILPSGTKTFLIQYRRGGRTRRVSIGRFGVLTCDEVKSQARGLLGDVSKGENPADDIQYNRRSPTVATVAERFLREHVAIRCKPTTQREYRRAVADSLRAQVYAAR